MKPTTVPRRLARILFAAAIALASPAVPSDAAEFSAVAIGGALEPGGRLELYARVLKDELERSAKIAVAIGDSAGRASASVPDAGTLRVELRDASRDPALDAELRALREAPLDASNPGPEGFLLRVLPGAPGSPPRAIVAGADERGVLYGVGELLRRIEFRDASIALPDESRVRTAPAFEVRGTEVSQGHTISQLTGSREWTEDEWRRAVVGYALAGANTFGVGHAGPDRPERCDFVRSLGLKTLASLSPNGGSGPPEWEAVEAIGRKGHLCLSVPEARAHILESVEKRFAEAQPADYVRFHSGDGGGCECEKCAPYGAKYIAMCEEIAAIVRRLHPSTEFFATNQKLDNAGDLAIFERLRAGDASWLRALCHGPGSNAMGWAPGRRQDHRMDLFRYPAFGAVDRYLRETLHQLPPDVDLVFFTDLTHWIYSQYGLMDHELIADRDGNLPPENDRWLYESEPPGELLLVYDRRTFFARPRHYRRIFGETMRYGIGDVTYSEGRHDHFNQWMWQRLMWNPRATAEEVVAEYCRAFFGPAAAPAMAEAIFLHEGNLSTPLAGNAGLDRVAERLDEAREAMGPARADANWLWLQYAQRAAIDRIVRDLAAIQNEKIAFAVAAAGRALEAGDAADAEAGLAAALARLNEPEETPRTAELREKARAWGEASDRIHGVRSEGFFSLDVDFAGLGWYRREIERALAATGEARRDILRTVARYEDPGPGGYYDDAGDPERSPRLVRGNPYGDGIFDPSDRASQRTAAFTTDESPGVVFRYDGLDPAARYRVRMTLVRPRHLPRFGVFQKQTRQSVFADEFPLAENLELPEYSSRFFEYDVPAEATANGELELRFEKEPGVGEGRRSETTVWRNTGGWGTLVSEVWLTRR